MLLTMEHTDFIFSTIIDFLLNTMSISMYSARFASLIWAILIKPKFLPILPLIITVCIYSVSCFFMALLEELISIIENYQFVVSQYES